MKDEWGQELVPLTIEDWKKNPRPRKMYVWDKGHQYNTLICFVIIILDDEDKKALNFKSNVVCVIGDNVSVFDFCAEISQGCPKK